MQRAIEPESPASDQTRLQPIVDTIAALTRRDLGARAPVSSQGDLVDAVAAGVNKLGEELAAASAGVERRVRERTSELARTNLELARRALYDPLTELPNRALYEDREMGVRTAVDDYGTGHASLGFVRRLPLDAVKIDRSLVRGIGVDLQEQAFVTGIVQLIGTLGLTTIAAGVEEQSQHAYLRSIRCDQAQGPYYSGPLEIEAAESVLAAPRRALERQD
jgi:EAL domain-containing protein (putative c-di-GMP-specific phosphodiesterase class I)